MTLITPIPPKQNGGAVRKRTVNERLVTAAYMAERFEVYAKRDKLFEIVLKNDHRKWNAIREIYSTIDTSWFDPYPVDWTRVFTPIECMAWGELRGLGLPFFPQYPILRFFADFADPVKKIAIECDGKKFHSAEKDAARDRQITSDGWKVFRISGSDCNRLVEDPWFKASEFQFVGDETKANEVVMDWAKNTIDGLVWAIGVVFYDKTSDNYSNIASDVVRLRMVSA